MTFMLLCTLLVAVQSCFAMLQTHVTRFRAEEGQQNALRQSRNIQLQRHDNASLRKVTDSAIQEVETEQSHIWSPSPTSSMECFGRDDSSPKQPVVTILTFFANIPEDYVNCASENRKKYAVKHGYEYCEYRDAVSEAESIYWQKWVAVKSLLDAPQDYGGPRAAVWWLDGDALIRNYDISFKEAVLDVYFKDVIFTAECVNCKESQEENFNKTNAGVFVLRNTGWARKFVDDIHDHPDPTSPGDDRLSINLFWALNTDDFLAHTDITSLRVMNSIKTLYHDGDLVYHEAGGSNELNKWEILLSMCQESSSSWSQAGTNDHEQAGVKLAPFHSSGVKLAPMIMISFVAAIL